jgi:hypothetical protein
MALVQELSARPLRPIDPQTRVRLWTEYMHEQGLPVSPEYAVRIAALVSAAERDAIRLLPSPRY